MSEYTNAEIKEAADKIIGLVGGKKNIISVKNDEFVTLRVKPGYDDDATVDGREIDEIGCIRGCFRGPDKVYILASKDIRTRLYQKLTKRLGLIEKIGNIAVNQDNTEEEDPHTDTEIKEAADIIIGFVGGKKNIISVNRDDYVVTLRVVPGYHDGVTIEEREIDEIECIRGCMTATNEVFIRAPKNAGMKLYRELVRRLELTEKDGDVAINPDHIGKEIDANGKILQKKAAPFAWEENPDVRRWTVLAVSAATLAVKVLILAKMITILKRKK